MPALPPSFATTCDACHTLAEHVLCAARYAAVGRVGLLPVEDGIATPPFDDRVVGLRSVELVDTRGSGERMAPVTTLRAAGEFFGITPGAPPLWSPTTVLRLDEPLPIDSVAVGALADWFALVADALTRLEPDAAQTLWPEHFDLAITIGEATYGGSPGDDLHPEPYAYVVPPSEPVPDGDTAFWREPFGAALTFEQITNVDDVDAFFAEARKRLEAATGQETT